ncbi:hypothetical protein [Pelosinus propionicus]|uniref:Uncharacterized protein n=1 Tax=Pelosinus propionicus DSM 13327 TaxID=1123291 RepID=A0A1I4N2X7_9FIRM|nr:hypothetical protein [Pelosinus propionicus]SFM09735.1 hypothetical protein SAMN04490355_104062 [Pelosinus propionicus DSM 13327]
MKLDFKVYKLKESSKMFKQLLANDDTNEFIVVGEDAEAGFLRVQQFGKKGIVLFGGLNIDECAYLVKKEDLELDCDDMSHSVFEIDIPKKYLTLDIVDSIKRLNGAE